MKATDSIGVVVSEHMTQDEKCEVCRKEVGACCPGLTALCALEGGDIIPCPGFTELAERFPEAFVLGNYRREPIGIIMKRGQQNKHLISYRRLIVWGNKFSEHIHECGDCRKSIISICDEGARLMQGVLMRRKKYLEMLELLVAKKSN